MPDHLSAKHEGDPARRETTKGIWFRQINDEGYFVFIPYGPLINEKTQFMLLYSKKLWHNSHGQANVK